MFVPLYDCVESIFWVMNQLSLFTSQKYQFEATISEGISMYSLINFAEEIVSVLQSDEIRFCSSKPLILQQLEHVFGLTLHPRLKVIQLFVLAAVFKGFQEDYLNSRNNLV